MPILLNNVQCISLASKYFYFSLSIMPKNSQEYYSEESDHLLTMSPFDMAKTDEERNEKIGVQKPPQGQTMTKEHKKTLAETLQQHDRPATRKEKGSRASKKKKTPSAKEG